MITLCHAATGGSGTTLVATTRSLDSPAPTLLVDLVGDVPAMLGVPDPDRPGVVDWLSSEAPVEHLDDLLVDVTATCTVLPATSSPVAPRPHRTEADGRRWELLVDWLVRWAHDTGGAVTIDAGTAPVPAVAERCAQRWLVTRACYLSLRRATRLDVRPTGVVLVVEPGRALRRRDVETAIGAPVVAEIDWDPRVARCVDAGLLLCSRRRAPLHRSLVGPLS
ncbi:hypothetical protein [Ilumatobacter sp.]|uniref:hypothetical protein n=1 Tax=Ilumatobacter sp. TaxID=1967498 RepID=UPI003B5171EA